MLKLVTFWRITHSSFYKTVFFINFIIFPMFATTLEFFQLPKLGVSVPLVRLLPLFHKSPPPWWCLLQNRAKLLVEFEYQLFNSAASLAHGALSSRQLMYTSLVLSFFTISVAYWSTCLEFSSVEAGGAVHEIFKIRADNSDVTIHQEYIIVSRNSRTIATVLLRLSQSYIEQTSIIDCKTGR